MQFSNVSVRLEAHTSIGGFMSNKGMRGVWKWSEEAKQNARGPRPASNGNKNGVTHGLSQTLEYNSWKKMMYRCYTRNNKDYPNYGGRGITVYEPWHDVRTFCADMIKRRGRMDKGFSLERIDPNGNYEPDNCTWIPLRLQGVNRRPWKHSPEGIEAIRAARKKK